MKKNPSTPNLLIVGSVAFDTIITPFGKLDNALGGSATYVSLAASYFTRPAVIGAVGEDFADVNRQIFIKKNIDISGLSGEGGKTFRWGGQYSFNLNERTTLFTELNVLEHFKPKLSQKHKKSEYVFLGNMDPKIQLDVLSQISRPKFVGLDTMNFWMEKTPRELARVLRLIDVLIINDAEARQLSQEHNLVKAAKKILGMAKQKLTLIIKRGEYGLLMFRDGATFHLPGYPLENVIDPTGAGDSFAGGFMGFLARTDNLEFENLKRACVYGSVMASFCCEKLATERLQNLTDDEIKKRYENFKHLTHFELL